MLDFLGIIKDTLIDSIKLLPFLFITYLIMEYVEHKTSEKVKSAMKKSGKFGPIIGGILGVFPQCGFSAAAANLYAGRIISVGTLIAVFLSTSDEMLPILISESVNFGLIAQILLTKLVIAIIAGIIIDIVVNKIRKNKNIEYEIKHICEEDHCHCEKGIVKSAIHHTINIFIYIVIITLIANIIIGIIGEDNIASIILNNKILGPMIACLIGLIPNCASSVILTNLYLTGMLGMSTMIAGLLVGSGVGLLVLFRVNKNIKENMKILLTLYLIGVIVGIIM